MVIAGFAIPSPGISTPGFGPDYKPHYTGLSSPALPELLIVPQIGLRAPVVTISIEPDGHTLKPPSDYHEVGWFDESAKPGSRTGQTLITGHTVHTGGGVMNDLGFLHPDALVEIKTKVGTVLYKTTKVFVYTKEQLSQHAQELFGQDRPDNRLVLVTCTGWTGSYYTSNIIVFATPIGVRYDQTGSTS